jgi:cell division septation protein DedD
MLFGSTMIEVAIGVIFVYLLVSLLCSALNELIEAWLRYRARYLELGIRKLLSDPNLAEQFFEHPLVKPLGERPSYIPARTFSLALWNIATGGAAKAEAAASGVTQNLDEIRKLIATLDSAKYGRIQTSLLTLIDEAGNDLNKARANIEAWYDDAMDRVSGWYKRRTHIILIILGLAASFTLNLDTIQITKALLYNDTLRKSVADAAENYVKENPAPTPTATTTPAPVTTTPTATTTTTSGTTTTTTAPPASPTPTPTPEVAAEEQARLAKAKIKQVQGELNSLGLPIGWPTKPDDKDAKYASIKDEKSRQAQYNADLDAYNTDPRWPTPGWYGFFLKLLGLILTGLAVSQGAPFWFDLLNKFIVIRSTVKPQEKSRTQPSKDKPAPDK